MNPNLQKLQPYPFEKLHQLFSGVVPDSSKAPISLAIGEPRHSPPLFVLEELAANLDKLSNYPGTRGIPELRQSIASWLEERFSLSSVDPETQVLPVNGTREALFAFAQAVVNASTEATVLSPNPFYQIYEGAALLAGASPAFINCGAETNFLPDFNSVTQDQWQQCQLLYLCSPGNPTGAVTPLNTLRHLIELAQEHNFVIASDECYSELYFDEATPPPGLLEACETMGNKNYANCVVFHSLSKRSNLPGLRSGFVAGDSALVQQFLQYRTYHGCAMPLHHQLASIAAWNDEQHVVANRALYTQKFADVLDIFSDKLDVSLPAAGFYLWPKTPISDTGFARKLYEHEHVTVLPGSFLARECAGINPGENRVRIALVAEIEQCVEAAHRILHFLAKIQ